MCRAARRTGRNGERSAKKATRRYPTPAGKGNLAPLPVRSRSLDAERQSSRPKESRAANDHASKPNPGLTHQLYRHSERVDSDQGNGSKPIPALTQKH